MQGGEQAVPPAMEKAMPTAPAMSATEAPSRAIVHVGEKAAMGDLATGAHGAPAQCSAHLPCCLSLRLHCRHSQ